ncbi:5-formyltetrahydrofolate cyclo-ligase, partial [Bacteroides cellulosilyticus]
GRGKGYYDRLLPRLTAFKAGICFPFQLVEEVPAEPFDIRGRQCRGRKIQHRLLQLILWLQHTRSIREYNLHIVRIMTRQEVSAFCSNPSPGNACGVSKS